MTELPQEIRQTEPRYPEAFHIYIQLYLTEVVHFSEYNWPVFSGLNRPTTVLVVFFGCDKLCVCVSAVLGVYLMYQTHLLQ